MSEDIKSGSKKGWRNIVFYLFLAAYSTFTIYLCHEINIWEDEVYTLDTTSKTLSYAISQSYHFEAQPPVYFAVLQLWRTINSSVFFARLLSFIFICIAAFFINRLVKLFSDKECSRWLVIIFLMNPATIWAATDMRTYALLILLSSILIYNFFRFYTDNLNKHLFIFLLISLIGIYTQYYFAFLVSSLSFSYLIFKGWRPFLRLCFFLLPVVLLFLPNLLFLSDSIETVKNNMPNLSTSQRVLTILHSPQNLLLAIERLPFDRIVRWCVESAFIFLAVHSYLKFYSKRHTPDFQYLERINVLIVSIVFLVITFIAPILLIKIMYNDKYMRIAIPLLLLLFTLYKNQPPIVFRIIYGTVSLYFIFLMIVTYSHPIKYYDFKSLDRYITKIERPEEPILFYRSGISLPFRYSYQGSNPIVPIPAQVTYDANYLTNIKDTTQLRSSIENTHTPTDSYLLISDDHNEFIFSMDMKREMITSYLKNHYKVALDTIFYGNSKDCRLRIRRIEKL